MSKKVLIIDDERDICELMKINLENTGEFDVKTVFSGEEGIKEARSGDYDLVITDFYMPGKDGAEVLKAIKESKPDMPVLLFSIYHDDESTLDISVKERADGIIHKPIKHDQLYKAIKDALAKKG